MDPKQHASASIAVLTPVVDAIRPDQLSAPTPCTKWTVADVLGHLVGGGHAFAAALRGQPLSGEGAGALAPDRLQQALHDSVADFADALAGVDDLDAAVTLPFATLPAAVALRLAAGDLLIHAWDLATATGQALSPPADLLDETERSVRTMLPAGARDGDVFAAEVPAPAGAGPLERIIAFSGRDPR